MSLTSAFKCRERLVPGTLLILMLIAIAIAIGAANSPYSRLYDGLLDVRKPLDFLKFSTSRPLVFWINETLMLAVFCWTALFLKQFRQRHSTVTRPLIVVWCLAVVSSVGVPFVLLGIQQQQFDIGHLAAVAADPALVWVCGLLLCRFLSADSRLLLVAFVASQSLVVLGGVYLYQLPNLQLGLGVLAAFLLTASILFARYGFLLSLLCAAVAWWVLLKMGLPGGLAGVALAYALPIPQNPNQRLIVISGVVIFLICPLLVANAGIGLRGVDPGYVLQLPALSLLLTSTLLEPLWLFLLLAIAMHFDCLPAGLKQKSPVLFGLALLSGASLSGQLYFGSLIDRVGNYHFDVRMVALCGTALVLAGAWCCFRSVSGLAATNDDFSSSLE